MIGFLYIDDLVIGAVHFNMLDVHIGVKGGRMIPTPAYALFRQEARKHYCDSGIANVVDFNSRLNISGRFVDAQGGIGVIDPPGFPAGLK
ncbi:MAG: hypothetical protein EOP50_02800 [Sphingobacteriales bacterium]|nr:MAG: hypothetical protein EOP50_02800 [Sphingobacteriales bacterium]